MTNLAVGKVDSHSGKGELWNSVFIGTKKMKKALENTGGDCNPLF